jgi:hypothetical protein
LTDAEYELLQTSKIITSQGDTQADLSRYVEVIPNTASLELRVVALELLESFADPYALLSRAVTALLQVRSKRFRQRT